ncbi:MAG: LacI family transcriptional regulator [Clostridiales bacterium]|nr:LacI family transcriptional regulator [Clostridiales bacterium]
MKKNGSISIKTISEMAGVSTATVSRVLNDAGGFSLETREKVQKAISEAGFVPNIMARGLRKNSLPLVGIIVPDIINEYFSKLVLQVQIALARCGYSVFICNTDESLHQEQTYLTSLKTMMISGLVCISGYGNANGNWPNVPTVYIDRHPTGRLALSTIIESDNLSGGYHATEEVLRRGCTRIAVLVDSRNLSTCIARKEGYKKAILDAGATLHEDLIFSVKKVDFQNAYNVITVAIQSGKKFDALFCTTDWLAMGALAALKHAGINVPDQVKVVGYDDISIAEHAALPITTIHQDVDEMSRLAVDELVRMMNGEPCLRDHWIVPVSLVRRSTT